MKYKNRCEKLAENSLTLASYTSRFFAFLLDLIVLTLLFIIFAISLQRLGFDVKNINVKGFEDIDVEFGNASKLSKIIIKNLLLVLPITYFTLTTFFLNGQSFGKKILGIRIVPLYHHEVGFWHCLERSLGYVASALELGLGFVQMTWNSNRMALHDKIAETIVVKKEKTK